MATRVVLTYRDYETLPADGRRYELHDGELSVAPAPNTAHQRAVGRLFRILADHVERHSLGEVFVSPVDGILSETTVVQPDILYLDLGKSTLVSSRGIEGSPTLVVEVLSASTSRIDRGTKLQLSARYGVPFYWMLDLDRRFEAYVLTGDAFRIAAALEERASGSLPPFADLTIHIAFLWR